MNLSKTITGEMMQKKNNIFKRIIRYFNKRFIYYLGFKPNFSGKPIPSELLNEYTLNGKIDIKYKYYDNSYSDNEPIIYSKDIVDAMVKEVKEGTINYYGDTGKWLLNALKKHSISGREAVVMGSVAPHCESMCIAYGVSYCTIIEYNKIISYHPQVKAITPQEYKVNSKQFDVGFSISSFEHDGLGRYGDPLVPGADLKIMKEMKNIIKPEGILFLSVPVGKDTLVWNAHRIYGRVRLHLLLDGWELIESFGFDDKLLDHPTYVGTDYVQPIFVLKNGTI